MSSPYTGERAEPAAQIEEGREAAPPGTTGSRLFAAIRTVNHEAGQ